MFPTLLIGDHLFVNKFVYGPRIPFTDVRLPGFREPERGDVVVFEVARDPDARGRTIIPADLAPPELPQDDFVKRIVGCRATGSTWRGGQVFVNGVAQAQTSIDTDDFRRRQRAQSRDHREQLGDCRTPCSTIPRPASIRDSIAATSLVEPKVATS